MTTEWPIHNYVQDAGTSSSQMPFTNFVIGSSAQGFGAYVSPPPAGTTSNHVNPITSTYQAFRPALTSSSSFCAQVSSFGKPSFSFDAHIPFAKSLSSSFDSQIVLGKSISNSFESQILNPTVSSSFVAKIPAAHTAAAGNPLTNSFSSNIIFYSPLPVQSVTDGSNPLLPTLIAGGVSIVSNVATNPGIDVTKTPYAVGYSLQAVTSLDTCDIIEWSVNLNRQGGDFEIFVKSNITPPNVLANFTICGLPGVVMEVTPVSGSRKGTYIRGIIGDNANLDKELILLAQGVGVLQNLVSTGNIQTVDPNNWSTLATCAQAIGAAAGVSVFWNAPDLPLTDAFIQTGMTARAALTSLASRVGAKLCWGGGNSWSICTPVQGLGTWEGYPDCSVIKDFVGPTHHGNWGMRAAMLPVKVLTTGASFNSGVTFVPLYNLFNPPPDSIIQLTSFDSIPDTTNAPVYHDLPGDFNAVLHATTPQTFVQIITSPANVGPTGTTSDQKTWFRSYIPVVLDSTGKQKLAISSSLFPSDAVSTQYNVGYMSDQTAKNNEYNKEQQQEYQRRLLQNQSQLALMTYYPLYTLTINSVFFNSVPIPGNYTTVSYDTISGFNGMVEDVSIKGSKSGADMTVKMTKYGIANVAAPLREIDAGHVS